MIPVHTRDTAGTGYGMPRCAKIDYRTRTRTTRFGKPAGFPVPVANPNSGVCSGTMSGPETAASIWFRLIQYVVLMLMLWLGCRVNWSRFGLQFRGQDN